MMDASFVGYVGMVHKMMIYALRYEWLRTHGNCPFAETGDEWRDPELMDREIDSAMQYEAKNKK